MQAQSTVSFRVAAPATAPAPHVHSPAAVFWLEPLAAAANSRPWPAAAPYRLRQKGRAFLPHILVVPTGASVAFPNADPYFHNVFSLFEGSRFDLGLYEAGSTRTVRFARKGVSYIFCNIHPEMGAVVLSLDTPLWTMASGNASVSIASVPPGTYEAHVWMEGQDAARLSQWTHSIVVPDHGTALAGVFSPGPQSSGAHEDKFGKPYKKEPETY